MDEVARMWAARKQLDLAGLWEGSSTEVIGLDENTVTLKVTVWRKGNPNSEFRVIRGTATPAIEAGLELAAIARAFPNHNFGSQVDKTEKVEEKVEAPVVTPGESQGLAALRNAGSRLKAVMDEATFKTEWAAALKEHLGTASTKDLEKKNLTMAQVQGLMAWVNETIRARKATAKPAANDIKEFDPHVRRTPNGASKAAVVAPKIASADLEDAILDLYEQLVGTNHLEKAAQLGVEAGYYTKDERGNLVIVPGEHPNERLEFLRDSFTQLVETSLGVSGLN